MKLYWLFIFLAVACFVFSYLVLLDVFTIINFSVSTFIMFCVGGVICAAIALILLLEEGYEDA